MDSVVFSGDDILFLVAGESPRVAAFKIRDGTSENAEEAVFLDELEAFYLDKNKFYRYRFYSHVIRPSATSGCAASSAQGAAGPAVDVICDDQVLTVRWDSDGNELYVSDWFQGEQTDRFGSSLRSGLRSIAPSRIAENPRSGRNYVLGEPSVGTLHVFGRVSNIETDPYAE